MGFIKLVWFMLFSISIAHSDVMDILRPKTVRVHKFIGVCPGLENAPITLENIHISYSNRIHMISLKSVVKENINEDMKMKVSLKRCKSKEALDSCEKYQTVTLNHMCDLIAGENKPWSPLVKMSEPPMDCPMKKGIHFIKNGTLDGSPFAHLPIANWYWIANSKLYGETSNRLILCAIFEGQLVPIA